VPIPPETVDRLTTAISDLVRTGRHLSGRAATQIYGELPSFGWALLIPLQRDGAQRVSALAHRAGIDTSVASRQLAVLERHGFVERRPDPRDGRAYLFRLTDDGAGALAATRSLRSDWAATALADWDDDAAGHLADLLERLVTDIDLHHPSAPPRLHAPSTGEL
jgi:DNA-binding MarR family transcriptional regulator